MIAHKPQFDIFNFEVDKDIISVDNDSDTIDDLLSAEVLQFLTRYNYFCSTVFDSFQVEIPPIVAKFLLAHRNPRNRPLDRNRIDQYIADANNDNWRFTGETIKFLQDGTIGDGQHRLKMVASLDKPVKFLVVVGLDYDALEAIDTGKPRTAKDVLSMYNKLGDKDAGMMATAIKKIIAYNKRATLSGGSSNQKSTTNPVIRSFFDNNSNDLLNSLFFVKHIGDKRTSLLQRGDFIFLHYIFSQIDKEYADEFMMKFITGAELPIKSNIYMLRQIIIKSKNSRSSKTPLQHMLFTSIKAWNNNRKNKVYSTECNLKFYEGDTYPIAV